MSNTQGQIDPCPHLLSVPPVLTRLHRISQSYTIFTKNYTTCMINVCCQTRTVGQNLRYEIGSKAIWPPTSPRQTSQINTLLTMKYDDIAIAQECDFVMADSSSLPSHKRSQLPIQLSIQQKKTKSDLQSEYARYTNQDIWLGFQAMELIATENEAPLLETSLSIREMIKKGYRESEAAEANTAKISFPGIP